jgi:hypothetical protein
MQRPDVYIPFLRTYHNLTVTGLSIRGLQHVVLGLSDSEPWLAAYACTATCAKPHQSGIQQQHVDLVERGHAQHGGDKGWR